MNGSGTSLPFEVKLPIGVCTIPQIKIDEALIRNTDVLRNGFEVIDAFLVQTDRDLFLEL